MIDRDAPSEAQPEKFLVESSFASLNANTVVLVQALSIRMQQKQIVSRKVKTYLRLQSHVEPCAWIASFDRSCQVA